MPKASRAGLAPSRPTQALASPLSVARPGLVTLPSPSNPPASPHADIARLVTSFYGQAREDALLGPVFERAVADWPHHLAALTAFWTVQLRGRGAYRGVPLAAHRPLLPALSPPMFARWLALWQQAARAVMSPHDAAILIAKAEELAARMGEALFAESAMPGKSGA